MSLSFKPLILRMNLYNRCSYSIIYRLYSNNKHNFLFLENYLKYTGKNFPIKKVPKLIENYPGITDIKNDEIEEVLLCLDKLEIQRSKAITHPRLFTKGLHFIERRIRLLVECGFIKIEPNHILQCRLYLTQSKISKLKESQILPLNLKMSEKLVGLFPYWPHSRFPIPSNNEPEDESTTTQIRMIVLQKYLEWSVKMSVEEFDDQYRKYSNYFSSQPLLDFHNTINLIRKEIGFTDDILKKNCFLISIDPNNFKMLVEHVGSIAGLDPLSAIKLTPLIGRTPYKTIAKIKSILEEFKIPVEAQRRSLRVFCMNPDTVRERLEHLKQVPEFQALASHPRMLQTVIHYNKMLQRLNSLRGANKHCSSLNIVLTSEQCFNRYLNSFGERSWPNDLVGLVQSLDVSPDDLNTKPAEIMPPGKPKRQYQTKTDEFTHSIRNVVSPISTPLMLMVNKRLRLHPFCRYVPSTAVAQTLHMLKEHFSDDIILRNCQILLYPLKEVKMHIENMTQREQSPQSMDPMYPAIDYTLLDKEQLLSMILYVIEKEYNFNGGGIWKPRENEEKNRMSQEACLA